MIQGRDKFLCKRPVHLKTVIAEDFTYQIYCEVCASESFSKLYWLRCTIPPNRSVKNMTF